MTVPGRVIQLFASGKSIVVSMAVKATSWLLFFSFAAFSQPGAVQQQLQTHSRQAQDYLKANRPDLAIGQFQAILKLDPGNVDVRNNLGTLLYFAGDYEKAAPELRAAVVGRPALWRTQTLLGMCEKRIGQMTAARSDLERAFPKLEEKKLRIEAGMELVEIYYASSELDKAALTVGALRQLEPTDMNIQYAAHQIYAEQADEAMLSLAMLAPNSARMHQAMAHEMARQGNSKEAIGHLRDALKIDPRAPGLQFELAEALSSSPAPGDVEEAEEHYKASLNQNPFDEKSECRLGRISSTHSDLQAAAAHYKRALDLQPDDPEANLGLGRTLVSLGQTAKAQPLLERAVQLDPTDAVAHFRLGTLYRQVGRTQDASRELAEFQRLKNVKQQLKDVYKGMRLGSRPELVDTDIPHEPI